MAEAKNQGGGGVKETEGTILSSRCAFLLRFFLASARMKNLTVEIRTVVFRFLGETSQAQSHSRGRGEEISSEEEGRGGAPPTGDRYAFLYPRFSPDFLNSRNP